jgi:hypothetical protein
MASVGRIAGALLAETGGDFYLVGNTRTPCDWAAAGFEPPVAIDAVARPYLRLARAGQPSLGTPRLSLDVEGEALARRLAELFLIPRTGSVSERLWRLVTGQRDEDDAPVPDVIEARWLGEVPPRVWEIVRDTVLRCT